MSTQYALLGLIATEPTYGYELKKLYDSLFGGDKPILPGQLYAVLGRLARDAAIEKVEDTGTSGGPERTRYAVTELGTERLLAWLDQPEQPAPTLQATLYMKVVLALMIHGDAAPFLRAQKAAHIARMRELIARRRETNLAERILLDNAIFHIEADIRWMDMTASRLTHLKEELWTAM
ncbi:MULTISPECIES: PadR family transcriptional regulator [Trueperella]|uniref:DNA-binding PadR family transcriptional regulator n=1 Tax=Trueperella abortisuis TaxID=445930 RepID=A0ABT9PHJ5_9ACTO|nr:MULTISPECIES: PadR family transcriptional regulator [Trueperella]MDP9831961.1 DNA-binding PadR family transcriptional regulator [Trueperella abortisuis]MDY5403331.1 PadR family transcriptional regulator [Trueperella sp.]